MPRKIIIKYLKDLKKPWNIEYAALKSDKFGDVQIGTLNGVVLFLYFAPSNQLKIRMEILMKRYADANFNENLKKMEMLVDKIFSVDNDENGIEVLLDGTDFQLSVWETLLTIPEGDRWTYSDCAEKIGKPKAVRAVGNAVGSNEIAYLIPCHRVVAKHGNKYKYGWGADMKKKLLDYEAGI